MPDLNLIVAVDRKLGIGIDNKIPWRLAEDMAYFKRTTTGSTVIMGRKTYDSIGKPLPNRRNIVVTRDAAWAREGVEAAHSLPEALALAGSDKVFIMGGMQIYAEALANGLVDVMYVTEIEREFTCDAHFPEFRSQGWQESTRELHHSDALGCDYAFVTYRRQASRA